jgi:hypothetical protein
MSKIKQIREAVDTRLDKLDAQLDAWEAQVEATREEALERVQDQKQNLATAADRVAQLVGESAQVAEHLATSARAELEHLQVQLALGRAESREAYAEQREKIHAAIEKVEDRLGGLEDKLEDELADEMATFVRLGDRVRAEFEAAEVQFALFRAEQKEALVAGRAELGEKLGVLRAKLRETRHDAAERLEEFEDEFKSGLGHIGKAFAELFRSS